MKNKKLLELKDGYISEIKDGFDVYESGSCPTCGFETMYVSEISFDIYDNFNNHKEIVVMCENYDSYEFTVSDLIKIFINNIDNIKEMTILEFEEWIRKELIVDLQY